MGWRDDLPPDAPKPKPRETMRSYALRVKREHDEASLARFKKAIFSDE